MPDIQPDKPTSRMPDIRPDKPTSQMPDIRPDNQLVRCRISGRKFCFFFGKFGYNFFHLLTEPSGNRFFFAFLMSVIRPNQYLVHHRHSFICERCQDNLMITSTTIGQDRIFLLLLWEQVKIETDIFTYMRIGQNVHLRLQLNEKLIVMESQDVKRKNLILLTVRSLWLAAAVQSTRLS